MKTILYQPLFINPQAYFVFPQLYHIEKGDSYIEPANITGQLIINDLTKSLTSTPILNVVQDTNQVDFGLFKGKHIRISQYTNIGAVVLGERYIPGTPTPPEPEQPDWFKESIIAWYSPYKQKLTNYDVIESYTEDFTSNNWKHTNNVTVTSNSFRPGIIRDSLGGDYYMVAHSDDYTIENGLMKSTDDTFLVSIENANENDVKAMIIDMYYDSTVPGSYLNGEYTEGSVKLTNRRIMGINNPTTTSIFQDLMQVLETGFTIGKVALYNKELTKDEFDSEAFHKGFAVRHSTFEKNASTHLFRDGHKELTPGEYLLPFETLYLRVDVPEGYTMQDYVFDEIEQSWKPNTPKSYICPEHDFHIIAMGEQMKVIKNWSPLASISTFGFRATDNQIEFAGSTDGGAMTYILDDTDVTKFTIQYTNTAGKGNVYLIIGDRQYDVISGQPQTYSVSGAVKLDFLNMEEVANFAGTIKFTNVV